MIRKNNLGQITIFIILGLIIVVGILFLFVLIKRPTITLLDDTNPQAFIESCTEEAVEDALAILSKQGWDITPKGFLQHEDSEITFLCYTSEFYEQCITQRPLLMEHIEREITAYIQPLVNDCFFALEKNLEKRYDVESGSIKVKTNLQPNAIIVDTQTKFILRRGDETQEFNNFKTSVAHPVYNLAEIATEITNQESAYCNFDETGYMILHPDYDITKFTTGEGNVVYTVRERTSGEKFIFAIRSCPLPPGY